MGNLGTMERQYGMKLLRHRHKMRTGRAVIATATLAALGLPVAVLLAAPAEATTATVAVTGCSGGLAFVTAPAALAWSDTLSGVNQTQTTTESLDVDDCSGTGAGWNIALTSTTFTTGTYNLPTSASTIQSAPTVSCDTGSTCTLATNSITYPYTVPAAATAPTATKMFDAAVNTGMGDQTVTASFQVAIPANTYAGTYTSTWTFTLATGP